VYINNFESKSKSTIKEFSFLSDWTKKFKENLHLNFGYRSNFRLFDVNRVNQFYYDSTKTLINVDTGAISKYKLQENYFYADLNHKINNFVEYSFGLQATLVHVNQKTFLYALPKFQFIYNPVSFINIRNSITYNMQPIHLLASLQNGIQNDIWVPAIQKFKPETAWQYASGIQFNLKKQYTISIDAFYRKMYNLIEYAGSNNFINNIESWETQVVGNGTGKAYGIEFFANKFLGQFTAWVKYNLTWSNRNFSNLNAGKDFFFKFDKRHDISINLQYKMKKHFDFSLSWVYTSGLRATIPIAKYAANSTINSYKQVDYFLYGEQNQEYEYSERNSYILPSYHHLDIGMNYTKQKKYLKHVFNVSIYNVYNRYNVFSIFRINKTDENNNKYTSYKQVTLFPILPSISYRLYFEK
jgi:outer membrane receptor protein involved in Fe transport